MEQNREIKIIKTEELNNKTVIINGISLHSKRYPYKSSRKFFDYNKKYFKEKKEIIIYGFGFGYHIKYLLDNLEKEIIINVFDFDNDMVKIAKKNYIYKELVGHNRVNLFLGYKVENLNELKKYLNENIIFYEPSVESLKSYNEDLYYALRSFIIKKNSIKKFTPIMLENEKYNLKYFSDKKYYISEYFKKYKLCDKPILIASGGPSLENVLSFIRENRGKFYVFSLGRTLKYLLKNNILPNNVIITDPQEVVHNQIKEFNFLNIPLLFLSTANKKAIKEYKGEKYIFFNNEDYKDNIKTGKTVALSAIDIAIKMKTKTIILAGQDLAYLDYRFHAGEKKIIKSDLKEKEIGVDNKLKKTTKEWLIFKREIENLINKNNNINFYNLSQGLRIQNCKKISFKEAEKILK
jgi:hypothetical protein